MQPPKPLEAVDSAELHLEFPGGNKVLRQVEDHKWTDELTREGVITVGSKRPRGFQTKPGSQMLELTVRAARVEEVNYSTLLRSGALCVFTAQYYANEVKGVRKQAQIVIAEVGPAPDGGTDGKHSYTVKALVIGEVQEL